MDVVVFLQLAGKTLESGTEFGAYNQEGSALWHLECLRLTFEESSVRKVFGIISGQGYAIVGYSLIARKISTHFFQ
jgi:hypothetical protein